MKTTPALLSVTLLVSFLFDITVSLSGILCVGLIAIGRREGYLVIPLEPIIYYPYGSFRHRKQ